MFLSNDEIKTHLYGEKIDTITRMDLTIITSAINAAIAEVKSYLSAYDTDVIFSAAGDERNPILLLYTKDIAVWHFVQLANPNTDLQLRLERYEKAVSWFDKIMRGQVAPDLPLKSDPDAPENNFIRFGGNTPRKSYF